MILFVDSMVFHFDGPHCSLDERYSNALDGMTWTRMYISDQNGSSGREKKRDFSRIIPINVQRIKMEYEEKTTQSMKPIARRSERFFVQRCRFFDDDFFDASIL